MLPAIGYRLPDRQEGARRELRQTSVGPLDAARESKRPPSSIPRREPYVAAARTGKRAEDASFVSPFTENGREELMKHECVHQHSLLATRFRISSAFSENQAFWNDQP